MKKKLLIPLALLLVVTAVIALVHRLGQDDVDCMVIRWDNTETVVSFEDLDRESFDGELIDGKGTVTAHSYRGVELSRLLEEGILSPGGAAVISVTSADNYTAEFTVDEVLQSGRIYLAIEVDGTAVRNIDGDGPGVQLVVFGDPDSRRCVRYAAIITAK